MKDVVDVLVFMLTNMLQSGLYNLGSEASRSFNDLAAIIFRVMHLEKMILYIDIPENIRDKYQYFTHAKMDKLRALGYKKAFTSLEEGIRDYVQNYLLKGRGL